MAGAGNRSRHSHGGEEMPNTGTVNVHDVRTDALIVTTESQLLNVLVGVIRERYAPTNTLRQARLLITDLESVVELYRTRVNGGIYAQYEAELGIDIYPEMVSPEWQKHVNGNGETPNA